MRLARRALFAALATLILLSAVTAQTLRPGNDPRNQAPTVGTGGPREARPDSSPSTTATRCVRVSSLSALLTAITTATPATSTITVVPLSFNVGINDHLELFFSTEGYRGVKVNNPKHLSSFYLPNSQLFFGASTLGSGPAIILAPDPGQRLDGADEQQRALPPGVQPAVRAVPVRRRHRPQLRADRATPSRRPSPRRSARRRGRIRATSARRRTSPASARPAARILPGVVLTTRTIPPNLTFNTLTVPDLFTICPTYVADAPFVNRLYGESSVRHDAGRREGALHGPEQPARRRPRRLLPLVPG